MTQDLIVQAPRWTTEQKIFTRVMAVYDLYMKGQRADVIASAHGISVPQVYVDIKRARQFMSDQFAQQLMHPIMEQVAVHKAAVRELYEELDKLKFSKPNAKRAAIVAKLMHEIGIQEKMVEELMGLRDRRGIPVKGQQSQEEYTDEMIVIDEDGNIIEAERTID